MTLALASPSLPPRLASQHGGVVASLLSMTGVNALKALVSVGVSFVVAGRVAPGQYGLVAFSVPLLTLVTLLTDLGVASAIVRAPALDRRTAGAAVSLMAAAGLVGGVVLLVAAWPLGRTLEMPGLGPVLALFAAVAAASVCAAAPRALLERRLDYRRIAAVELAGLALGVASFAVLVGPTGILSLVGYQLGLQLLRAGAFLTLARPFFEPTLRFRSATALLRTGTWILFTNLLSFAARNLDNLLVGAWLGASALGLYGLAYQFMTVPLALLTWPASGVLLSTLSRLQHDGKARREAVAAVVTATAAISFPLMAFVAVGTRLPLDLLYGHRWLGLHEVVAVLAPVGALQAIAAYSGAVLLATGQVRLNFAVGLANGVVLSVVFLVAVPFGLGPLIGVYAAAAATLSVGQIAITGRAVSLGALRICRSLLPGVLAAAVGTAAFLLAERSGRPGLGFWLSAVSADGAGVLLSFALTRGILLEAGRTLRGLGGRIEIGAHP